MNKKNYTLIIAIIYFSIHFITLDQKASVYKRDICTVSLISTLFSVYPNADAINFLMCTHNMCTKNYLYILFKNRKR